MRKWARKLGSPVGFRSIDTIPGVFAIPLVVTFAVLLGCQRQQQPVDEITQLRIVIDDHTGHLREIAAQRLEREAKFKADLIRLGNDPERRQRYLDRAQTERLRQIELENAAAMTHRDRVEKAQTRIDELAGKPHRGMSRLPPAPAPLAAPAPAPSNAVVNDKLKALGYINEDGTFTPIPEAK